MADPRFFDRRGPFTLGELAGVCGADPRPAQDIAARFDDVAPLHLAGPTDVSFLDNPAYVEAFRASRAGTCIVSERHAAIAPLGMRLLVTPEPYRAYALVAVAFYPEASLAPGVHPRAIVDPSARLGEACEIGPGVVIEAAAEIGARCRIGANAVVGRGVRIGADTEVGANASLSHCLIGARVLIHPGVRIGQRGFGFASGPQGYLKVPQLGRVVVEDDVEIGANTTIDRGAGPDTVIGAGTMIDNLVQIGHNVQIGRGCVLVAQVGISGSTRLGDRVQLGGQAGLAGHLSIGAGTQIGAQSGVIRDLAAGERVFGTPARPVREFFRQTLVLARLAKKTGD